MQKFEFLRQPLLGELAMSRKRERKKEKKMPFIVATDVYASSQGQRTHSARTKSHNDHEACRNYDHTLPHLTDLVPATISTNTVRAAIPRTSKSWVLRVPRDIKHTCFC